MSRRRWKLLGLLIILFVFAVGGYWSVHRFRWREQPDANTGVAVELRPARQVIKVGEAPDLSLTLINHGNREVILVEPGDGSSSGWRTPQIEWSRSAWFQGRSCGNINALKPEEVFTLQPGESRKLCAWISRPSLSGPGVYRMAVRYTNRPDQHWKGIPLGEHDAFAVREVLRSTHLSAVSNSVEIVVED